MVASNQQMFPRYGHSSAISVRSIEGWILVITNVHEEASEEGISYLFGEHREIENVHLNLDRRSDDIKVDHHRMINVQEILLDEASIVLVVCRF